LRDDVKKSPSFQRRLDSILIFVPLVEPFRSNNKINMDSSLRWNDEQKTTLF